MIIRVHNAAKRLLMLGFAVFAAGLLTFCAESFGRLDRNDSVYTQFQDGLPVAGYNYFYSGPEGRPSAILGLNSHFRLQDPLWTSVKATHGNLGQLVQEMNDNPVPRDIRHQPFGYDIRDAKGNSIGVWYSYYDWTTVQMKGNGVVDVYPPSPSGHRVEGHPQSKS